MSDDRFRPFDFFPFLRRETTSSPERRVYNDALSVYRAWHIAEGEKRDIIDFNLTPKPLSQEESESLSLQRWLIDIIKSRPDRVERRLIVEMLEKLRDKIDQSVPSLQEGHNWRFLRDNVSASVWFAKKKANEVLDNRSYIENTIGVPVEMIPDWELQAQQEIVFALLDELGIDKTEQAVLAWKQKNQLSKTDAEAALRRYGNSARSKLENFLNESFNFDYTIKQEEVDKYYWVWADTDENGNFVLRQNFSSVRQKFWTPGKAQELGWHEVAEHLVRMAKRKDAIARKQLHPVFGLTTVHGREPVIDEGLAQTLVFFVPGGPESLSTEGKFQVHNTILRQMVYSNLQTMYIESQEQSQPLTIVDAYSYVKGYLPHEARSEISKQFKDRTVDPLMNYQYAYGAGAWRHLQIARALSPQGEREYLKNIYSRPYTAEQERLLVQNLLANPRNRSNNNSDSQANREPHLVT